LCCADICCIFLKYIKYIAFRNVSDSEVALFVLLYPVLRIRIRDPGLDAFLTPGSGIRDEQPGSYFLELRNHFFAFLGVKMLKFFDEDPGSGMETVRIRDLGWEKVGSGIRDKHPGSATLPISSDFKYFTLVLLNAYPNPGWIRLF
jgi:hypothetical protein